MFPLIFRLIATTAFAAATCLVRLADMREAPALESAEVHVWLGDLALGGTDEAGLDPIEKARARRYYAPRDRDRYVGAHQLLRRLLGKYLHQAPEQVGLVVDGRDKPHLAGRSPEVQFNLSHSDHRFALGVLASKQFPGAQVGVDIERVQGPEEWKGIRRDVLSPEESAYIDKLGEPEASQAFYRVWTIKESVLKALGTGRDRPLPGISVLDPNGNVRLSGNWENKHYRVIEHDLGDGYRLAVTVVSDKPIPDPKLKLISFH